MTGASLVFCLQPWSKGWSLLYSQLSLESSVICPSCHIMSNLKIFCSHSLWSGESYSLCLLCSMHWKHSVPEWQVASYATSILCIHLVYRISSSSLDNTPWHHSSWTGRFCINDVTAFIILFFVLKLSSLVLQNKSSFFFACRRLCMRSFLQVKCNCIRNIS